MFFILVKEQEKLVKIVQENLDEKITQKRQGFLFYIFYTKINENFKEIQNSNENNKGQNLQDENKIIKIKYSKLKGKYLQIEGKIKTLLSEREKILGEKSQLQEKNHSYIQDATRLHQLSEEMKEFENKVYTKRITQLEKQISSLESEIRILKTSDKPLNNQKTLTIFEEKHEENFKFQENLKENYKENYKENFKENFKENLNEKESFKENKMRIESKLERLINENNKLVVSMQNALDSCASLKIPDFNDSTSTEIQTRDLKELFSKIERLLNENEILKKRDVEKEGIIMELNTKINRNENNNSHNYGNTKEDLSEFSRKNNELKENMKNLDEKLRMRENELHGLEIKVKYLEENEIRLKSQLQTEFLYKDKQDLNLIETMQEKIINFELEKSKLHGDYHSKSDDLYENQRKLAQELELQNNELKKIIEELKKNNEELNTNFKKNEMENSVLKDNIEKNRMDLELEKDLRNQYFCSIKELETILRSLMNEGDMYRHYIKQTVSEENKKVLEKYKILLKDKTGE